MPKSWYKSILLLMPVNLTELIFFITPLLVAGIIHHFFVISLDLFSFLASPVDAQISWHGRRILGNSKTWRGLIIVSLLAGISMHMLSFWIDIPLKFSYFTCGLLLGLGYSIGEFPNSFLKRRLNIKKSEDTKGLVRLFFFMLDHVDSILGAIVFLHFFYSPSFQLIIYLFAVGTLLHFTVDYCLTKFGYKKTLVQNT